MHGGIIGIRRRSQVLVWLISLVFIAGCDQLPNHTLSNLTIVDSKYLTTSIPADFRMLSRDELSANIALNGINTTVNGADYPDGNWQIPIDVEAGQTYSLFVQWRLNELLLMEETGSFTVDENTPEIRLELDFINSGLQKFDNDCDGKSNLVEVRLGSDPQVAEENGNEVCLGEPNPAITLTESNRAYVTSFHDGFGQESQNRVIERLEQPLQIRKSIDQASSYGFTLYAPGDETIRATIVLVVTEDGTKQAQVRFTRALDEFESSFTGSRCFSYDQGSATESGCDIPYVWQDNTWYSLILDQTGDQWAASIKNLDTGIEDTIGTFTGDAVHRWQSLQIGLSHRSTFTPEACDAGVPSIRAHFGRAIVNSDIFSEPLNPSRVPGNQQIGACALASGDWNFSPRSELEDPLFAFELGQLE